MIRFEGRKAGAREDEGVVGFEYSFGGGDAMEFCRFPGRLRGLREVTFAVAVNGAEEAQVVQVDDVRGVVYR